MYTAYWLIPTSIGGVGSAKCPILIGQDCRSSLAVWNLVLDTNWLFLAFHNFELGYSSSISVSSAHVATTRILSGVEFCFDLCESKFCITVVLTTIIQWEKLILISGRYENRCENRFSDSRRISSPVLWSSSEKLLKIHWVNLKSADCLELTSKQPL